MLLSISHEECEAITNKLDKTKVESSQFCVISLLSFFHFHEYYKSSPELCLPPYQGGGGYHWDIGSNKPLKDWEFS